MKKSSTPASSSALTCHAGRWGSVAYLALLDSMAAPLALPSSDTLGRLHEANRRAVYLLSRSTVVTVGPGA